MVNKLVVILVFDFSSLIRFLYSIKWYVCIAHSTSISVWQILEEQRTNSIQFVHLYLSKVILSIMIGAKCNPVPRHHILHEVQVKYGFVKITTNINSTTYLMDALKEVVIWWFVIHNYFLLIRSFVRLRLLFTQPKIHGPIIKHTSHSGTGVDLRVTTTKLIVRNSFTYCVPFIFVMGNNEWQIILMEWYCRRPQCTHKMPTFNHCQSKRRIKKVAKKRKAWSFSCWKMMYRANRVIIYDYGAREWNP